MIRNRLRQDHQKQLVGGDLQNFTGWQENTSQQQQGCILKQLKNNLNNYEKTYQILNKDNLKTCKKVIAIVKENSIEKENQIRLPVLSKHQEYSSFLEDENFKLPAGRQSIPIKHKQFRSPMLTVEKSQAKRNRSQSLAQFYQKQGKAQPELYFIKKHRVLNISKTLKLTKIRQRRASTKLVKVDSIDFPQKYSSELSPSQNQFL